MNEFWVEIVFQGATDVIEEVCPLLLQQDRNALVRVLSPKRTVLTQTFPAPSPCHEPSAQAQVVQLIQPKIMKGDPPKLCAVSPSKTRFYQISAGKHVAFRVLYGLAYCSLIQIFPGSLTGHSPSRKEQPNRAVAIQSSELLRFTGLGFRV